MTTYNIYCDESCHLEHDGNSIFVLGGIMCDESMAHAFNSDLINLKSLFGFNPKAEMKWTKISPGNVEFYLAIVDYFFDHVGMLRFRGYVGRGKDELDHSSFSQTYDEWYYKMYYRMLEFVFDKNRPASFNCYLDIKDTLGAQKVRRLRNFFNSHYASNVVNRIQLVRSDEIALLQLADVFIGALSYRHRNLRTSSAKLRVIERIEQRSAQSLLLSSSYRSENVNWFIWTPESWR